MMRPLPVPTAETGPFWAGARRGELMIPHCTNCSRFLWPPGGTCPSCGESPAWQAVAGGGTLYSHAAVRRAPSADLAAEAPYVVALVDLDVGVRLFTNVVDCRPEDLRIGMQMVPAFRPIEGSRTVLPVFVPAATR